LLSQGSPLIDARSPYIRPSNSYNTVENLDYCSNAPQAKQEGVEDLTYSTHLQIARSPTPYYGSFGVSAVNTTSKGRRRTPVSIAPNPVGLVQMNARKHPRDDSSASFSRKRPRVASNASTTGAVELTEDERLLLRFKDEENLPWKDIALKFQTETGRTFQVPALQMRYKRLREKLRVWSDADVREKFLSKPTTPN
jgi:hypothetical protein